MKLFAALVMVLSFDSYAQTRQLNLSVKEALSVTCPKGSEVQLFGTTVKCGCPADEYPNLVGDVLKCETLCEITVGNVVIDDSEDNCDQGGCGTPNPRKFKALMLRRKSLTPLHNKQGVLFLEEVYSPRPSEIELLLNEAKIVAKKYCFKTIYNGKYLP